MLLCSDARVFSFFASFNFVLEIDQCRPNPCQHGGYCREVVGGTGFACQCITGYKGSRCEGKKKYM